MIILMERLPKESEKRAQVIVRKPSGASEISEIRKAWGAPCRLLSDLPVQGFQDAESMELLIERLLKEIETLGNSNCTQQTVHIGVC